jgi:hypothetical protein
VQAGGDINAIDPDGLCLLHRAAACGDVAVLWQLLENGADVCALDRQNRTAIRVGNQNGHARVTAMLAPLMPRGAELLRAHDDNESSVPPLEETELFSFLEIDSLEHQPPSAEEPGGVFEPPVGHIPDPAAGAPVPVGQANPSLDLTLSDFNQPGVAQLNDPPLGLGPAGSAVGTQEDAVPLEAVPELAAADNLPSLPSLLDDEDEVWPFDTRAPSASAHGDALFELLDRPELLDAALKPLGYANVLHSGTKERLMSEAIKARLLRARRPARTAWAHLCVVFGLG